MSSNPDDTILDALQKGRLDVQGEFLWGSNYTFLTQVEYEQAGYKTVYKPTRGERRLWDFPASSLAKREVAAYLVSEALGWRLVPPTVYRKDAPFGPGSLQFFVEHDPQYHYFNLTQTDRQRLRPVVVFDLLVNNADRKGSHILFAPDGHIWLIDHGICFHVEDKLRTVIWDYAGESLPPILIKDLRSLIQQLAPANGNPSTLAIQLGPFLNKGEVEALIRRAKILANSRAFPNPHPERRPYPWPPV